MSSETSPPAKLTTTRLVGPRGKRIMHTGGWSLIAKACAAANLFISVPLVLSSLGPEQFGAWATLISLVTFAGFLDFGFGNGAMNLVAAAHGRGAPEDIAIILRESRRALMQIALALALVGLVVLPVVPWHRVLGMPVSMAGAGRAAAAVVIFAIVLAVPLNLANRVQLGLGRGDRAFFWQAVGQLLALVGIFMLARLGPSLPAFTAVSVLTPLLTATANSVALSREHKLHSTAVLPRHPEIAAKIRREGALFFTLQMGAALVFSTDLPLIASLRGATEAGIYAIVDRFFSVIPMGLSLLWVPLWPIYRQALAAGDHQWVAHTVRRSLVLAVTAAAGSALALTAAFNFVTAVWLHRPLAASNTLVVGFAVWSILHAAGMAVVTLLNAASIMRFQVVIAIILTVTCLPLKVFAAIQFGAQAVIWVTIVVFFLLNLVPIWAYRERLYEMIKAKTY